ncbi:GntR family transcriptional regulator [Caballeronia pedi]|uniref:GntR family transcriptional regulator n=1 Tax=Caballeronia pedi TaxID=1777141 RepID=A0A157ZSD2_9BURK|nr:GntR family transcriptional regulator [Caballeronia pedi]SAK48428.1 GntR family transcriptional regulator [Caballeronia pedi]
MNDTSIPTWEPVRARTMVDAAVDAIVSGASRGLILPGDRIVEAEIAEKLGVSRVPVREALRMLESQGIVSSVPNKGIRLVPVSRQRVLNLLEARLALEMIAVKRLVELKLHNAPSTLSRLRRRVDEIELMVLRQDYYGLALADVAFHREVAEIGGNDVVANLWAGIARQLTIALGLTTQMTNLTSIVEEHHELLAALEKGNLRELEKTWTHHVNSQNCDVDYEKIIEERREQLRAASRAKGKV